MEFSIAILGFIWFFVLLPLLEVALFLLLVVAGAHLIFSLASLRKRPLTGRHVVHGVDIHHHDDSFRFFA